MPSTVIRIDGASVFNDCYLPFRTCQTPLQIFYGGSSSGKSVAISQRLVEDLLEGERNFLVLRKVSVTIRRSTFNEVVKIIDEWDLRGYFEILESSMVLICLNGYSAFFGGLDDPEKLKSITPRKGVITDIWLEEATEFSIDDFKLVKKRLRGVVKEGLRKRIVLSFNPIFKSHWIYKFFFSPVWKDGQTIHHDEKLLILKTTYKDNRFLTKDDIELLEDESDPYYYDVYTLGEWGVLGDLIFTNWKIEDVLSNEELVKTFDKFQHGLDFGYTNDPTAYNKIYYHPALKKMWIVGEHNETGLTNEMIADRIKDMVGSDYVTCDSAEPKSIVELNGHGINAIGARKGKDSVLHGIQWLRGLEIIIDVRCQNTINDFQLYQWKKDKDGTALNIPIDKNNHHPDAIRYAMEDYMLMNFNEDEPEELDDLETANIDW